MIRKPEPSITGDPYDWVSDGEERGSEPPRIMTDERGREWQLGDCWCTLAPTHDGKCHCEPCTQRLGAPGWTAKDMEGPCPEN